MDLLETEDTLTDKETVRTRKVMSEVHRDSYSQDKTYVETWVAVDTVQDVVKEGRESGHGSEVLGVGGSVCRSYHGSGDGTDRSERSL